MPEAANAALQVLAVDDDPSTVREIEGVLDDPRLTFHFADTANAFSRLLESESIDLAIIHLHTASLGLLDPLTRQLRAADPPIALIAMVDPDSDSALAAARSGVDGCVRIDDPRGITRVIGHSVAQLRRLARQAQELRQVADIHERYNLLLESSSEAIAYLHEGLHIYANPSYLELFGYPSFDELEGFSILDLLRSDDSSTDLKHLLKSLARGDLPEEALTLQAVQADGETFRASAEFAPAHYDGEPCTQIMVRKQIEAGDNAELQQELEKLRSHDLLTGLLNRQAFIRQLHGELERPPAEGHMAVVLAMLDKHAALQSRVGAAATDLLIRQTAEIFSEAIGEDLLPTRLSDHVLAARLWFGERSEAEALATKVVETFSGRILEIRDKSPQVTASVGLALGGSQKFSADELLAQAETALREAERTGGNSYMRYRPPSTAGDENGEQWADKLRHALNNEEFRLVSLPITSMEDDEFLITEFETRLRLEGSDEVIMPAAFRPAAREADLSVALDRDLIGHLLKWRKQNPDAGDMLIALSAECLADDDFVQWLQQLVDDGDLAGQSLILGFHESEIGEQLRELQRLITRFAMRGVRFALLDVSIDARLDLLLKNINFNYIKLAADIGPALRGEDAARDALQAMVRAGGAQDARFIAPQVENTSELAALWQFGITLVQDDFVREE